MKSMKQLEQENVHIPNSLHIFILTILISRFYFILRDLKLLHSFLGSIFIVSKTSYTSNLSFREYYFLLFIFYIGNRDIVNAMLWP